MADLRSPRCTCWRTGLCPHIAAVGIWAGSPELAARPGLTPERTP